MSQIILSSKERQLLQAMHEIGIKYIARGEPFDDGINDGELLLFPKKPIKEKRHGEWVNADMSVSNIVIYDNDFRDEFQFLKYSSRAYGLKQLLEQN